MRIRGVRSRATVQDGNTVWSPESGQVILELATPSEKTRVTSLDRRRAKAVERENPDMSADEWYDLGCALIERLPEQALQAFRSAIRLSPGHAEAHVNSGFLLQSQGENELAEAEYRLALEADPASAIAAYNLGVVLEDQGRPEAPVYGWSTKGFDTADLKDAKSLFNELS